MKLQEFEVLYLEKKTENYTVYVCKKKDSILKYRVLEITEHNKIAEYVAFFSNLKYRHFHGDFCIDECYYLVFTQPEGVPIDKNADISKVAQSFVKAFARENMPPAIAMPLLSLECMYIFNDEITFAYIPPITNIKCSKELFYKKLADFIRKICPVQQCEEVHTWLMDLENGEFKHLLYAFQCMPEIRNIPESTHRDMKKVFIVIKMLLILLLCVGAVLLLRQQIPKFIKEIYYDGEIEHIGEINVNEE